MATYGRVSSLSKGRTSPTPLQQQKQSAARLGFRSFVHNGYRYEKVGSTYRRTSRVAPVSRPFRIKTGRKLASSRRRR